MTDKLIGAREIQAWIPPSLDEVCGNYQLVQHLKACLKVEPPSADPHMVVMGSPGTGKTSTVICYLRLRLDDPSLGYDDDAGVFTLMKGKKYDFIRIDGASMSAAQLGKRVDWAINIASHTFVLLDEAGELYYQGLDTPTRRMFDCPTVTVYSTAQDFHHRRKRTDTDTEDKNRIRAYRSRLGTPLYTELPDETDLVAWLKRRLSEFRITPDKDETLSLLARKSAKIVRDAMAMLVKAVTPPNDRKLTYEMVARWDPELEMV